MYCCMYYYVLHCDFCNLPASLPPSLLPPPLSSLTLDLLLLPSDPLSLSHSFCYSLEEFNLDDNDIDANTTGLMNDCSSKTHTHNLSMTLDTHSLLGMYTHIYTRILSFSASNSSTYLPDFVLHGTSESMHSFQPKLEKHLASMVKVYT